MRIFLAATAMAALFFLLYDLSNFIDFTPSIIFLYAPIVASLNHVVITRCALPDDARAGRMPRSLNIVAVGLTLSLAIGYFLI